jgi:hypothetical protein
VPYVPSKPVALEPPVVSERCGDPRRRSDLWIAERPRPRMRMMLTLVATLCTGAFFGAALAISVVQHPAVLETGADFALRFFPPMYGRAAVLQAGLAIVGTAAAATAFLRGAGRVWLAVAILLGSVVPFTLIVIKPVNDVLLGAPPDPGSAEAMRLLTRWGVLHAWRTAASGLAFLACVLGLRSTS